MVRVLRPVALAVVLLLLSGSSLFAQPGEKFDWIGTEVVQVSEDGQYITVLVGGLKQKARVHPDVQCKVPGVLRVAREDLPKHFKPGDVIDASGKEIGGELHVTKLTKREKK